MLLLLCSGFGSEAPRVHRSCSLLGFSAHRLMDVRACEPAHVEQRPFRGFVFGLQIKTKCISATSRQLPRCLVAMTLGLGSQHSQH